MIIAEFILAIDPAVTSGGAGGDGGEGVLGRGEELFAEILSDPGTRLPSQRRYANRELSESGRRKVELRTALYDEIKDVIAGTVRTTGRF